MVVIWLTLAEMCLNFFFLCFFFGSRIVNLLSAQNSHVQHSPLVRVVKVKIQLLRVVRLVQVVSVINVMISHNKISTSAMA